MKTVNRIETGLLMLMLVVPANGQIFTNIYFPGLWPDERWWTNSPLPTSIVSSNAWYAENENWRMASNAFASLQSLMPTTNGFVGAGVTNGYPWTNCPVPNATLAATATTANGGWPTTWAGSSITAGTITQVTDATNALSGVLKTYADGKTNAALSKLSAYDGSGTSNLLTANILFTTNSAPATNTIVGFFWWTNGANVYKVPCLQ